VVARVEDRRRGHCVAAARVEDGRRAPFLREVNVMDSVGLMLNLINPPVNLARELVQWFADRGVQTLMLESDAPQLVHSGLRYVSSFEGRARFVAALGGDGTFLRAARWTAPYGIPILAANLGHLGFLSELGSENLFAALEMALGGDYALDTRMMLQGRVEREAEAVGPLPVLLGLNDLVIHRGSNTPVLTVHVQVGDVPAASYRGDGVIISTPTGSTGYALSAGGPIVHPGVRALLIAPVCPHMLQERPMLVPGDEAISVTLENVSARSSIEVDGQTQLPLFENDRVVVTVSDAQAAFIRTRDFQFFSILQNKLKNWRAT
jgi:NAD+ kinase